MRTVTITETVRGSRDGFHVESFVVGQTYSIPDGLARNFEIMGVIAPPEGMMQKPHENKAEIPPENKAIKPETKQRRTRGA